MKIAVIGVSSLIGQKVIELLEKDHFPLSQLIPVEKKPLADQQINFRGKNISVIDIRKALKLNPEIAFFTGDPAISLQWAEKFAKQTCYVIDNSPVWRMEENVKMIIPEINADILNKDDFIIASPNCTSIQMIIPLAALHRDFKVKRIVVSTYQSASGAGTEAVSQLENERFAEETKKVFPHPIHNNCIPHVDEFNVNGYTKDEIRLMNEIKKILNAPDIHVTATCARIPVDTGHSESLNIEFKKDFVLNKVKQILSESEGVNVLDAPFEDKYPMPVLVKETDDVLVGRIRRDYSHPKSLNLWVTANNLRRGAATNAINIARLIYTKYLK